MQGEQAWPPFKNEAAGYHKEDIRETLTGEQ